MTTDPKRLLGGYATDSLTEAERQELLRAALDDQKVFDALVEEEGLRALLAEPEARQRVLAGLDQPDRWERWRAFLRRPATAADLLAVAAVLVVALVAQQVYRATSQERALPAAARPAPRALSQANLDRLAALPPSGPGASAGLALDGHPGGTPPRVSPGEPLAIRVTVKAPARVLLLEVRPDGSVAQAWPSPGVAPALLAAPTSAAPTVQRLSHAASSLPGTSRLRLVVAPADFDIAAASPADIEREASRLALVDLTYETERP
jgi:hypothetical protein